MCLCADLVPKGLERDVLAGISSFGLDSSGVVREEEDCGDFCRDGSA
jgi:hypothetical protein